LECTTALTALQLIGIQAQQIGRAMNKSTMWASPGRHRDVVAAFAGHQTVESMLRKREALLFIFIMLHISL